MLDGIKAVIFDLDGTLIDSMWVWSGLDEAYMKKYHLESPQGFPESVEGMSIEEVAEYFLKEFPTLTSSKKELIEEWLEMAHTIYMTQVSLKSGALELLEELKKRGIKIGIATSNLYSLAIDTLRALGVEDIFDTILSSGQVSAGKPAPDVYLEVAKKLGISPKDCLVFEDVPMGILAGKRAGMTVCAVEDDFSKNQREKKKELANYYIQNFYQVLSNQYETLR